MAIVDINEEIAQAQKLVKPVFLCNEIQEIVSHSDLEEIFSASRQLQISLVMLVKNQEEHIQEVLERIKTLHLDEYHVIDTGSTDLTVEILKGIDDITMHQMQWEENYALMRNKAVEYARSEWILSMDSDELLLTENLDLRLLVELLRRVNEIPFGICFEQHSKEQSYYGVPVRLYNKNSAKYYGLVHEELRDIETGMPAPCIQTRVKVENFGSSREEIEKFSKDKRYSKLLYQMMEIEPENPRWFTHLPANAIVEMVQKGVYEDLLIKYLFKKKVFVLSPNAVEESPYTKSLFQKYISYCIMQGQNEKALELDKLGLNLFPKDVYLMFYQSFLEVEKIRQEIKRALKENLGRYLSLNKQEVYDESTGDTQLLEVVLAELNLLSGNQRMAEQIVENLTASNVIEIWKKWNR